MNPLSLLLGLFGGSSTSPQAAAFNLNGTQLIAMLETAQAFGLINPAYGSMSPQQMAALLALAEAFAPMFPALAPIVTALQGTMTSGKK